VAKELRLDSLGERRISGGKTTDFRGHTIYGKRPNIAYFIDIGRPRGLQDSDVGTFVIVEGESLQQVAKMPMGCYGMC
jgi:hypothetical protein